MKHTAPALAASGLLALAIAAAATPAIAARSPWHLGSDDGGPMLSAGEGEDVTASLHCKAHAGRIEAMFLVEHAVADHLQGSTWMDKAGHKAPWAVTVHAVSGAIAADIPGKANADEMNGGSEINFSVPATAPVAQAFAASGALKLTAFGETPKIPPAPAAIAAKFVKSCAK
jgi:hypothetical protein